MGATLSAWYLSDLGDTLDTTAALSKRKEDNEKGGTSSWAGQQTTVNEVSFFSLFIVFAFVFVAPFCSSLLLRWAKKKESPPFFFCRLLRPN